MKTDDVFVFLVLLSCQARVSRSPFSIRKAKSWAGCWSTKRRYVSEGMGGWDRTGTKWCYWTGMMKPQEPPTLPERWEPLGRLLGPSSVSTPDTASECSSTPDTLCNAAVARRRGRECPLMRLLVSGSFRPTWSTLGWSLNLNKAEKYSVYNIDSLVSS